MRIFLTDSDYGEVISEIENSSNYKNEKNFIGKKKIYADKDFGNIWPQDYYLTKFGFTTFSTIMNAKSLQNQWFKDHSFNKSKHREKKFNIKKNTLDILGDQIKLINPDIMFVKDIKSFSKKYIEIAKAHSRLLVGEIASDLPSSEILVKYDLIFSAHPGIVEQLKNLGIMSEYVPLGFDARCLSRYETGDDRDIDICFVGSDGGPWNAYELFRQISETGLNFRLYGNFKKRNLVRFGLYKHFCGQAYGREMYRIYARSKIVVNRLGLNTGNFSVNMRMYEATGMGGLLLTEQKPNLMELFDVTNEIQTYASPSEAAAKCRQLIFNEAERARIAKNGQMRTLNNHTYELLVKKMISLMNKALNVRSTLK